MARGDERDVIVIGGGQSARLVADRLTRHAGSPIAVTLLAPGGGTCQSLAETATSVVARLSDGRAIRADAAVLATGCASFSTSGGHAFGSPKRLPGELGVAVDAPVLLRGTSARAVRYALAAARAGHQGSLIFVGRLPLAAVTHQSKPLDLSPADIPLGTGLRYLLRWFRWTVAWALSRGSDARALIQGLKPHAPLIWQHLTAREQRRFVVHLRPLWMRALDGLTPEEGRDIAGLLGEGRARVLHGAVTGIESNGAGVIATLKENSGGRRRVTAALAIDFEEAPAGRHRFSGPITGLIEQGLARPDAIDYGLDVTEDCALIDARGRASARIFAVGAPTRGRFVDAMDIERIRLQSDSVLRSILRSHVHSAG